MCQSNAAAVTGMGSNAGDHAVPGRCVGMVIPLPEPLASQLVQWRASFGDPMAAVVPPHITLITTTPATNWSQVLAHVRGVAREQEAFRVTLRGTGTFRPVSPVVYLKLTDGFDACVNLHERLQRGPLARALEFVFHPHVTVAHDVSEASMDSAVQRLQDFESSFMVRSMGLFEHEASGVWTLQEELKFGRTNSQP